MKNEKTIAAADAVQHFALSALYLSEINPRQDVTAEEITDLANSIRACGLIQSLAGLVDKEGRVAIVAGGRRLRALQEIAATDGDASDVPVKLAQSEEQAALWAHAENTARADLHPADEIRAYGKMVGNGESVAAIASVFAVTEPHVIRRLKLAALPSSVLDALKAGEINLTAAEAFTLANSAENAEEALTAVRAGRFTNTSQLSRFFTDSGVDVRDKRVKLVGIEAYEANGGAITRDLFSETVILHDVELIDRLFAETLAKAVEAAPLAGWLWAEVIEANDIYNISEQRKFERCYSKQGDISEAQADEYDALSELAASEAIDDDGAKRLEVLQSILDGDHTADQKRVAGVLIYANYQGELITEAGYIRCEDREAAYLANVLTRPKNEPTDGPKSPFSNAVADDLKAIELSAVQSALLAKPELVLDLLAFALSDQSGDWSNIMGVRLTNERNQPSEAEGFFQDTRITDTHDHHQGPKKMAKAFQDFRAAGKKARNAEITKRFARALAYNAGRDQDGKGSIFEAIAAEVGADMRKDWTPTAAGFFKRMKADYLTDLYCELFDLPASDAMARAFEKKKKGEKAEFMEQLFADPDSARETETAARVRAWRPTGY